LHISLNLQLFSVYLKLVWVRFRLQYRSEIVTMIHTFRRRRYGRFLLGYERGGRVDKHRPKSLSAATGWKVRAAWDNHGFHIIKLCNNYNYRVYILTSATFITESNRWLWIWADLGVSIRRYLYTCTIVSPVHGDVTSLVASYKFGVNTLVGVTLPVNVAAFCAAFHNSL